MFQMDHVHYKALTVTAVINLPAPPNHYGVFDVFADFQSFFLLENLGRT